MKYKLSLVLSVLLLFLGTMNAGAAQLLFQPSVSFPAGTMPSAVGIGDFNRDGLNDVAITNSSQLLIFLQMSSGSLASPVAYEAGFRPESLAVGDLNNDGGDDVVVTNFSSNTISVFLQQSNGTLASRMTLPTSTGPDAVAVGDLNSDGLDDIAVSHWNAPNIGIFTQTSAGTLNAMVMYSSPQAGYDDIDIGDVNHDGRLDVIKMNGQGYVNPHLSVYLQNEEGALNSMVPYSIGCSYCLANGIGTGDVTGDGLTDIVVSYGGNRPGSQLAVFAQAQDGSLRPSVSYPAYDIPEPVEVADVNGDGLDDAITLHGGWRQAGVFLQQDGILSPYSLYSIPNINRFLPQGLDIGDINQDGAPDLVIADYNYGLVVLYHAVADTTPPTISVTALKADNTPYVADTWTNQTVTLKYTCSDSGTGIASCPADKVLSAEGNTALTTGTATDMAGNSAHVSFGPIKIDKTPPTFLIGVSPNPVMLKGNATLSTNATDALSGIQSGSVSCSSIDTSVVGARSITCSASDYAGNKTTATAPYQVIYDFEGFLSPIVDCVNNPCSTYQLSSFSAGSSISLKFRLRDANGTVVLPATAPIWLAPMRVEGSLPILYPDGYPFQTTGITYTWRKSLSLYQYDWSTRRLQPRTNWLIGVKLDDGKTYYVFVALK